MPALTMYYRRQSVVKTRRMEAPGYLSLQKDLMVAQMGEVEKSNSKAREKPTIRIKQFELHALACRAHTPPMPKNQRRDARILCGRNQRTLGAIRYQLGGQCPAWW